MVGERFGRSMRVMLVAVGITAMPVAAQTDEAQRRSRADSVRIRQSPQFRFATLSNEAADLRTHDGAAVTASVQTQLAGLTRDANGEFTLESLQAAGKGVFADHSFEAVEHTAKNGGMTRDEARLLGDARTAMIQEAMRQTLEKVDPSGQYFIGALDSGNKSSGAASDVDQTIFVVPLDPNSPGELTPARVIEAFNETFEQLYDFDPERMGIESMDGREFPPDWRQVHSITDYETAMRAVAEAKRENTELYRSEGELQIQAVGRGEAAIREFFDEYESRDSEWKRRTSEIEARTDLSADEKARQTAEIRRERSAFLKDTPFTTFGWSTDENGQRVATVSLDADPRRAGIMASPPEKARRFAFGGAYDNWFMWENHPHNRPKYFLRSGGDGPGMRSQVGYDGVYDLDKPWRARPFDYDVAYKRGADGLAARQQFVRDVYGAGIPGTSIGLDAIERAYDAAAKARLKHKDGSYSELQVWEAYMPENQPGADPALATLPEAIRLEMAQRRWESDAREIMIQNLLLTVQTPGEIINGYLDTDEMADIRRDFPEASPTMLRKAAWLQLFHGFRDLMSEEHAREITSNLEKGIRPLDGLGGPAPRQRDLVDRLVAEVLQATGPDADAGRAEIEKVLIDAASSRLALDFPQDTRALSSRAWDALNAELRTRFTTIQADVASARAAFADVNRRIQAGDYSRADVARSVANHAAYNFAQMPASVLGSMGLRGEVVVLLANPDNPIPSFQLEFAKQPWDGKAFVTDLASVGNADALATVVLAYQRGGAAEAGMAAAREMMMNLPGADRAAALYEGAIHNNWQSAFQTVAGAVIPGVGQGYALASLATNTVQILGNVVIEPLKVDRMDEAYQGFLGAENNFRQDARGQRLSVLEPVAIRVVPMKQTDPTSGDEFTTYLHGPITEAEFYDMVADYSGDPELGIELEGTSDELEFARQAGLMGGGAEYNQVLATASDWINNPRGYFEAKRVSLYPHYKDRIKPFLQAAGFEDMDLLLASQPASQAVETLRPYFMTIVNDWAQGTGEFSGRVGGENELRVPWQAQERMNFYQHIARRMAGDMIRSYRIVRMNLVALPDGVSRNSSLEAGLISRVHQALTHYRRQQATQLALGIADARAQILEPEIASAMHRTRMKRHEEFNGQARFHVRPKVTRVTGPDGEEDEIEWLVSVIADPAKNPAPYRTVADVTVGDSTGGFDVRAVVRVFDGNGAEIGDSVALDLGTLETEMELRPLVAAVEVRTEVPTVAAGQSLPTADSSDEATPETAHERSVVPPEGTLIYDDAWVFFTPPVDTIVQAFRWRVAVDDSVGNALTAVQGQFDPGWEELTSTARTGEGAPTPFVAKMRAPWRNRTPMPGGTYRWEWCELQDYQQGVFGTAGSWQSCGPWQDAVEFEVGEQDLTLVDLVTEEGIESLGTAGAGLTIESANRSGGSVTLEARAQWTTQVDGETRPSEQRATVSVDVPEVIDLQRDTPGTLTTTLQAGSGGLSFNGRVHQLAPAQALERWFADPSSTLRIRDAAEDLSRPGSHQPVSIGAGASQYVITNLRAIDNIGMPSRGLPEHIRSDSTLWVLPVEVSVPVGEYAPSVWAWAIYSTGSGGYAGPQPKVPNPMQPLVADGTESNTGGAGGNLGGSGGNTGGSGTGDTGTGETGGGDTGGENPPTPEQPPTTPPTPPVTPPDSTGGPADSTGATPPETTGGPVTPADSTGAPPSLTELTPLTSEWERRRDEAIGRCAYDEAVVAQDQIVVVARDWVSTNFPGGAPTDVVGVLDRFGVEREVLNQQAQAAEGAQSAIADAEALGESGDPDAASAAIAAAMAIPNLPGCLQQRLATEYSLYSGALDEAERLTNLAAEAANDRCDYQEAERVGTEVEAAFPSLSWVQLVLPEIRRLAARQRDARRLNGQASNLAATGDLAAALTLADEAVNQAPDCDRDRYTLLADELRRRQAEEAALSGGARAAAGPVRIERSMVLLIDASGSMSGNDKIGQAKAAATHAVNALTARVEVALITYSGGCDGGWRVVQDFTRDRSSMLAAIQSVGPGGGTPMAPAVGFTQAYIERNARGAQAQILLLSDGANNCGSTRESGERMRSAAIPIKIDAVGLGLEEGGTAENDLAELIAGSGNGQRHSASSMDELIGAFMRAAVADQIRLNDPGVGGPAGTRLSELFRTAVEALDRSDFRTARTQLEQATREAPSSAQARYNLSLGYEAEGQRTRAIEEAEAYLQLAPRAPDAPEVRQRIERLRNELRERPSAAFDAGACRNLMDWGAAEGARVRDPAQRALAFRVMNAAQRGECDTANSLFEVYRTTYGG